MSETPRIVVGIDGSEPSRRALRWALAEALLRSATLEVLHAWRTPMLFVPDVYDAELVELGRMDEAALAFVEHELDAVGADGDCPVDIEQAEVQHFAPRALIEASHRAQLVVIGRHGIGGFPHELLTPKVVQVAHHAACAVAVVPDSWSGGGRGVIVGIDGSEPSIAALKWAADEARLRSAPLTALMAWGLLDQHHAAPGQPFDPAYGAEDAMTAARTAVTRALGAMADVEVEVANDLPARALIERSADAELLVVGARGLGGFADLLLGSVSHRCLGHSTCPTVVVR